MFQKLCQRFTFFGGVDRGVCDIEALAGVEEIDVSTGTNLVARDGDTTCFGDGRQAFVVSGDRGDGAITTPGGNGSLATTSSALGNLPR